MADIAIIAAALALVSLIQKRIATWPLTGPMLFVCGGMLLGPDGLNVFKLQLGNESITLVAELTLALLLFSDASRINTAKLRQSIGIPARLLGIGLPLTIAFGTVMASVLLMDLRWSEAALVAAILAPTDAALGQAVVTDTRVPVLVRQSLNVESGLNDGMVVPIIGVFALLVAEDEVEPVSTVVLEALKEIGLGVGVGVATGVAIGLLTAWARRNQWADTTGIRVATFGGAVAGFGTSVAAGGNGFIAAFVAGLALHIVSGEEAGHQAELAEDLGQVGATATFFIFGALMVLPAFEFASWAIAACAIVTLTVGRMLPVAIALLGTGLKPPTVAFMGWFGPRGLASMLFGLLIVGERGAEVDGLFSVIALVVFASVMLHGLSAAPLAAKYGAWYNDEPPDDMMESGIFAELRLRGARDKR